MNIKCPKCETLFDYNIEQYSHLKIKFKCSVCNHMWEYDVKPTNTSLNKSNKSNYDLLIILNLFILLVVILAFIVFRKDLEFIDLYWESIYLFFDTLIPIQ